jgi:hypothetical protein
MPSQKCPTWYDSDRLRAVTDLADLARDWDTRVRMAESLEQQLSLFEIDDSSPRHIARQAVLDLAAFLEIQANDTQGDSEPVPFEAFSQLLNYVRHRHHLARRAHFHAFIKEIDAQLARELQVVRNVVAHQHQNVPAAETARPSFLSRLAGFLGLSQGAAEKEFRTLSNRDLEGIWDALSVDPSGYSETQSVWELLLNCIVELVGDRLSDQVVSRDATSPPDSVRENVVLYGLWSGTPPPSDVAARRRRCSSTSEFRGSHAAFFRSGRGRDLQHRLFRAVA